MPTEPSSLGWVRILIWIALAFVGVFVLVVVFSGGMLPDDKPSPFRSLRSPGAPGSPQNPAGEMAYDRFRPGGRQGPPAEPPPQSETEPR